jgi:micrococcal nuclease
MTSKFKPLTPYTHAVMLAVLGFVIGLPGGYYGYEVVRSGSIDYVSEFDDRYHQVADVIDGDTIRLTDGNVVRLLGMDAPEAGNCYSNEATSRLTALVAGRDIYFDKAERPLDQTGRLLRYVFVRNSSEAERGDIHVNKALVREGYATSLWIAPNRRYQGQFEAAENDAQEYDRGMWNACEIDEQIRQQDVAAGSDECIIKGNVSEQGYGNLYYVPGCANYNRVKIDPDRGEQYFCSESAAELAGFTKSSSCNGQ